MKRGPGWFMPWVLIELGIAIFFPVPYQLIAIPLGIGLMTAIILDAGKPE